MLIESRSCDEWPSLSTLRVMTMTDEVTRIRIV